MAAGLGRRVQSDLLPTALAGLGLLAYYISDNLILAAGATALVALVAWRRLDLALLAVPATAPFYRFPKALPEPIGSLLGREAPFEIALSEYALLTCAAVWALKRIVRASPLPADLRTWGPPLLLVLPALLSLPFAEQRQVALREFRVVVFEPALFYVLAVSTFQTTLHMSRAVWALVLTGTAVAGYALYHYAFIGVVTESGGVGRALAVYHSPNALALFLGRVLPVAAAIALSGALRPSGTRPARLVWPSPQGWLAAGACSFVMLAAVVITFSRGALLALAASLGFVVFATHRKAALVLVAGTAFLLLAALPFLPLERLSEASPVAQRFYVWDAALRMALDHPLTGVGLDNFLYQYPRYMLPEAALEPGVSHAHNLFLDFWTRLGILGLAAIVGLQFLFWWTGAKLLKGSLAAKERILALAMMASMLDFVVHGLLDNSYFLIDLAFIFWLSFTLLMAFDRSRDPRVTL